MKEIEINGCIAVPEGTTHDQFWVEFIAFIESKGWTFGGKTQEIND